MKHQAPLMALVRATEHKEMWDRFGTPMERWVRLRLGEVEIGPGDIANVQAGTDSTGQYMTRYTINTVGGGGFVFAFREGIDQHDDEAG